MKEQGRNLQGQIKEEEIGKPPEKQCRIIIVKMMQSLKSRMEKVQESSNTFNKDLEEIKKKQTEMNNTITEIKNTLQGINSRIIEAEEWISELEDSMVEISEEQNKGKRMKSIKDSLRELW